MWRFFVYFCRKRTKDEQVFSQVIEKRRETKLSKEEELREQKKRERESARAYERWLNRKVLYTSVCVSFKFIFYRLVYSLFSHHDIWINVV